MGIDRRLAYFTAVGSWVKDTKLKFTGLARVPLRSNSIADR
jgi:hypothetical protein